MGEDLRMLAMRSTRNRERAEQTRVKGQLAKGVLAILQVPPSWCELLIFSRAIIRRVYAGNVDHGTSAVVGTISHDANVGCSQVD